jgi:hypothetical protein
LSTYQQSAAVSLDLVAPPDDDGRLSTPAWWQAQVRQRLAEMDARRSRGRGTRTAIAKKLGFDPSVWNVILSDGNAASKYTAAISRALDVPLPRAEPQDEWHVRLAAAGAALAPDQRELLVQLAESMARGK